MLSVGTVANAQNAMGHGYYGPALWANSIFGRAPQGPSPISPSLCSSPFHS